MTLDEQIENLMRIAENATGLKGYGVTAAFHGAVKSLIAQEIINSDRRTLETIAALLNGDYNQVEVVKNYVHNKLEMYRVKELEDATR